MKGEEGISKILACIFDLTTQWTYLKLSIRQIDRLVDYGNDKLKDIF